MESEDLGAPEPKGMDADERREMIVDRRQMPKRAGLGAAALAVPAAVMATPSMGAVADALAADSFIKSHPKWKFNFVNHVTTNPFFVPTIYGAQDACSLLGTSYQWTGSTTSDISQMVNAMNAAITQKADGIAVCLVSLTAFNGPTNRALGKGIPVLSYNADAANNRLAPGQAASRRRVVSARPAARGDNPLAARARVESLISAATTTAPRPSARHPPTSTASSPAAAPCTAHTRCSVRPSFPGARRPRRAPTPRRTPTWGPAGSIRTAVTFRTATATWPERRPRAVSA